MNVNFNLNCQCKYLAPKFVRWGKTTQGSRIYGGHLRFGCLTKLKVDATRWLSSIVTSSQRAGKFRVKVLIIAVCGYYKDCLRNTWVKDDRNYKHIYVLAQTAHIH